MRKISDKQLISMGLYPIDKPPFVDDIDNITPIVVGPFGNVVHILCDGSDPKGFDPLSVRLSENTPIEVNKFISAMTTPHASFDTGDSVKTFNDIIPRCIDAASFGKYFDKVVKSIPYKSE